MKNKTILLSVIIISILSFVVSCQKSNFDKQDKYLFNNKQYSKTIMQRIEHFNRLLKTNFKDGTSMTVDSAVWNLEALLTNYGGFPDSVSKDIILKRSRFTLPLNSDGLVSLSNVRELYQKMMDTIKKS